jgi:hypothetical protein
MEEGEEFEGELEDGEKLWDDDDDDGDDMLGGDDDDDGGHEPFISKVSGASCVEALPSDNPAVVFDAVAAAKRLDKLQALMAEAREAAAPAAAFHLDRDIRRLSRGLHAGGRMEDRQVNDVLRRAMADKVHKEHKLVQEQRAAARKRKQEVAKVKAAIAKSKAAKAKASADKKARAAKLATLPKKLSPDECGKPGAAGQKARRDALERLKLHSPPLHWSREARWGDVKVAYAAFVPKHLKFKGNDKALGVHFVKEIRQVLENLGSHYKGHSDFKKKPGDPNAFAAYFKAMENSLPKGTLDTTF